MKLLRFANIALLCLGAMLRAASPVAADQEGAATNSRNAPPLSPRTLEQALSAKPAGAVAEQLADRVRAWFGGRDVLLKGAPPKIDELFVRHVRSEFAKMASECQQRGVAVVGINSNDVTAVPDDGLEGMRKEAHDAGYTFPYLFDETQEVAKAFRGACTPDFFLFDVHRHLLYRGQFDDSRPDSQLPVTGKDLKSAVEALLAGRPMTADQRPSLGCNIKWKQGAEPEYFRV